MAILFWWCLATIVYIYLGYPLALAFLARLRPRRSRYAAGTPTVTLLISAYNEGEVIAAKLDTSLKLDYPRDRLQILVAADGSDDQTVPVARRYAGRGVEVSYSPLRKGKMAAINRAWSRVRGEVVVFSDANNFYAPNVLRQIVVPFADPGVGAVSGAKSILAGDGSLGDSERLYWQYESFIKTQETRLGCCTAVAGEVLAIRRDLFELPPEQIINDDFYLAMRIIRRGYRLEYVPEAKSYERVSLSAQDEIARRARIVAGRYQALGLIHKLLPPNRPLLWWAIISHKFLRPLLPLVMVGALVANVALLVGFATTLDGGQGGRAWQIYRVCLLLQLGFYGLAGIGGRLKRGSRVVKLLYLPAFLFNSNLAAVIGLYRFVTGRQTALWQRVGRRPQTPSPPLAGVWQQGSLTTKDKAR